MHLDGGERALTRTRRVMDYLRGAGSASSSPLASTKVAPGSDEPSALMVDAARSPTPCAWVIKNCWHRDISCDAVAAHSRSKNLRGPATLRPAVTLPTCLEWSLL